MINVKTSIQKIIKELDKENQTLLVYPIHNSEEWQKYAEEHNFAIVKGREDNKYYLIYNISK